MMRSKDLIRILTDHGFVYIRSNKHYIYKKDSFTVAVPLDKVCSIGLCRRVLQQAGFDKETIRRYL